MTAQTRREFIKAFAAAMAAALGASLLPGCTPTPTCYAPVMPVPATLTAIARQAATPHPAWSTLRQAWLDVRGHRPPGAYTPLVESHQATLRVLVDAGKLEPAVAAQIQGAFAEVAAYYAKHSGTPTPEMTCYIVVAPTDASGSTAVPASTCYTAPELVHGRAALVQEAAALEAMATQSALDPATVDKARRALEQDIALFELVATFETLAAGEHQQQEDQLVAQYLDGKIDVPPEAAEAALILVALLTNGEVP